MPKLKSGEAGSLSNSERQKLQKLYTHGGAAYGSVSNVVETSNLSVSKVRQFLQSKPSYTKLNLATRRFKRRKSIARSKIEIWCMELAYVDKLAKDNNGMKYFLVSQDLFDRTVDAKGKKTKDSEETVRAFLTKITKKNRPKKISVDKGIEFAGEFKKLCKAEGIQIYSTMSETKAAFAERTIGSLKNILYRYMENNGYNYTHTLTQFVTTLNSRKNWSIDLIIKNVNSSAFFYILYSKPIREFTKPKFKFGDRVRISKYDLPFRKGYKPQFTKEVFESDAIFSRKPLKYTIKDEQDEINHGIFIRKSWSKSFNNGIFYKRMGSKSICATVSRQYIKLFYNLLTRATESGRSMGGGNFRNILPITVPKCQGGIFVFWP